MMRERMWKSYTLEGLSVKTGDTVQGAFSGYASTWTKDLENDKIAPGAFAQSIVDKRGKIPILFNHFPDNLIGFSTALAEDQKGLLLDAQLSLDSSMGADAFALLKTAAAVDYRMGLSIGFMAQDWDFDQQTGVRTIKQIDLWETSITAFPANPRALVDDVKSLRNFEKRLRDVGGFSLSDAKRILSLAQRSMLSGDPDGNRLALVRDVRGTRSKADMCAMGGDCPMSEADVGTSDCTMSDCPMMQHARRLARCFDLMRARR
jgi:HK97 family phage prohead protease